MLRLLSLAGCYAAMLCTTTASAEEFVRPFEKAAHEYYVKLKQRRFEELDREASTARRDKSTIEDGQPRLATIYGGIAGCLTSGCRHRPTEAEWQQRYQLILQWRQQRPHSVTAAIAHASYFLEHAYSIRGGGYANTVPREAWIPFEESVETARREFEELTGEAKNDPGYYSAMLDIGTAQGWPAEKIESLYRTGIGAHPTYLPIYFSASVYYSPRWHGSIQQLRAFIEDATAITRAEMGETLYARLNWSLPTGGMFLGGQTDWQRMKAGFEDILKKYPHAWNLNNYAKFACHAEDDETLARLADRIGDAPIEAAWNGSREGYDVCVTRAREHMRTVGARSGNQGNSFNAIPGGTR